jgi:hypothetical protein
MPTTTGTSVIGIQTLYTSSGVEKCSVASLHLDPNSEPALWQKLGTMALQQQGSTYTPNEYMTVNTKTVRNDGLRMLMSLTEAGNIYYALNGTFIWRVQVNWRQPGINWTFILTN